jgi:hypothetical protein
MDEHDCAGGIVPATGARAETHRNADTIAKAGDAGRSEAGARNNASRLIHAAR